MLSWLGIAAVAVACGGKFTTTVDSSKPASGLTPADSTQLCQDEYHYVVSSVSLDDFAKITCISSFQESGDCQTTFDSCVAKAEASASGTWPPTQAPDCTSFAASLAKCDVTVGQYSDCIEQEVNVLKSIESKLPFCTEGDEESAVLQADSQLSAECLNIMQECPLDFGGSSSSSSVDAGTAPDGG
jgi:hypothetical protein